MIEFADEEINISADCTEGVHHWKYDPLIPCVWRECRKCGIRQKPDYSGDIMRDIMREVIMWS